MIELLPCPFANCGGPAVLETKREPQKCAPDDGHMIDAYVWCHECGARGPHFNEWAYDDASDDIVIRNAIDGWNRRSVSSPDLLPPLTASIAIVADRDRFKRERDELLSALTGVAHASTEGDLFTMINRVEALRKIARMALEKVKP